MGSVLPCWSADFVKGMFHPGGRGGDAGAEGDSVSSVVSVVIRRKAWRPELGKEIVGFAIVTFRSPEEASSAHDRLNGQPIPGGEGEAEQIDPIKPTLKSP